MRVKLTGQFTNGHPYTGIIPKESITEAEAIALMQSYDVTTNESKSDDAGLDFASIQMELFDDFEYKPVMRAALFIALDEVGQYNNLITMVNEMAELSPQGKEMKFWLEGMRTLERYDARVSTMQFAMGLTDVEVDNIFKRAMQIEAQNL